MWLHLLGFVTVVFSLFRRKTGVGQCFSSPLAVIMKELLVENDCYTTESIAVVAHCTH